MSLLALYEAAIVAKGSRKPHVGLSVAQVANGCARAVYHNIHHGLTSEFSLETKRKMQLGLDYEDQLVELVHKDASMIPLPRDVVVFHPGGQIERIDSEKFDADPQFYADRECLVGHPDLPVMLPNGDIFIWEIKTTSYGFLRWVKRKNPAFPDTANELRQDQPQYVLQAAAYAYAYGAPQFGLHVYDRESCQAREYTYDTATEWPDFLKRWEWMKEQALYATSEPEASPPPWTRKPNGTSYICASCPVTSCFSNPNYKKATPAT